MIYVHGGGWQKGDKREVGEKSKFFTELGWVFISINYRLLPEGRHPSNAEDVGNAVVWVHENIGKYGGAAGQLFLMGHSAGSHLVSLVATDERYLKKYGKDLNIIKGVIALDSSAYDVPALMKQNKHKFYASVFEGDLSFQKDASPLHHVKMGKGIPPFLIYYSRGIGFRKTPARRKAAISFQSALKTSRISAKVVDASDRNHKEINVRFGEAEDEKVTQKAKVFLLKILENRAS
ncbi:MAG: alpha/beta hydrolase [Verrucomicrobiales bacterium]|nr:alpha/beta hydrolase [Verrucomicrobiales bacterium]